MREIKARAWDYNSKKWHTRIHIGINCCNSVYDEEHQDWFDFDEFCGEIVLWTGLNDKHGNPIYEGDIIRSYNDFGDSFAVLSVVKWNEKHTGWEGVVTEDLKNEEIIGNIYENGDLLSIENS